ncbi:MAG: multiheme c-type cytochrome [Nitrospirota bacterium]
MKVINFFFIFLLISPMSYAGQFPLSDKSQSCIGCHKLFTPGIVEDWLSSRHSKNTPEEALKKPSLERRFSAQKADIESKDKVVGCFECHGRNQEFHRDNFEHFGFMINVVVSPKDCATCHPAEELQFRDSKKANAYGNLAKNPVFKTLVETITGVKKVEEPIPTISFQKPSSFTIHETCYGCHGTEVKVTGMKERDTKLGKMSIPDLANWPNQGVGRINPDGSMGACTACHPRHSFLIQVARKPFTCSQCHLEPDVPGWNVYDESKHGDILFSLLSEWNFSAVPWKLGADFKAPSCSVCHNSLITTSDGNVIAERTHDFGARLWVRLFGLIYSHPQPRKGDTSIIKNRDGLPLPTTFSGEVASDFLIDPGEQNKRRIIMKGICNGCHNRDWVDKHFAKLDDTIGETDQMILAPTKLLVKAWDSGIANRSNPFDEAIEQKWIKQWLFYGNSVKYASAMTGAPDYTTFKNGWWDLTNNLMEMKDMFVKEKHKEEEHDDK